MINKGYLFFIISLFAAVSNDLIAANVNSSSLFNTNNAEDSLYYDVFRQYRVENIDSALKYARLSYDQAQDLNDIELSIKSLNALGYCYYRLSVFDSALYSYKKGIQESKIVKNEVRQIYFYNSIGIVYDDVGKYDSAIANFYFSLELARKLGMDKDESVALTNIGNINLDLDNAESAINYYLQSAEIKERNNFKGLDISYYNIGLGYNNLGDHQNAINYFKKVIELCDTGDCNPYYRDKGLMGLGISYFGLEKFQLAEEYIDEVKGSEDVPTQIIAYRYLSELYSKKMDHSRALEFIQVSNRLAKSTGSIESQKLNFLIQSNIYSKLGMTDSAFVYLQNHYTLKDSVFNETVAKSIQDLLIGFERDQAAAQIQVKEREIRIRKRMNILFTLVIILSISLLVKFFMDLTKRKRMNKYLDKQVAIKTSELTESNKNLSDKSKDLNNLIYNISHEIRGPLARLLGLINIGKLETDEDSEGIKYYNELRDEAIDLERILKRMIIINNVTHHEVKKVRIDPNDFFHNLFNNSKYLWEDKIEINLDVDGVGEIRTDVDLLEIALQNMIDNAVRFRDVRLSTGAVLDVQLARGEKGIDIILKDNGTGFDEIFIEKVTDLFFVASEKGGTGMGLHHTKLALDKIGAEFEVLSSRDPTTFVVHL